MSDKKDLRGVFLPITTPFHEDQTLDVEALEFNISKYNTTDIGGVMPLGSNGEFRSLSDAESLTVIRSVKKHLHASKTMIVGAGRESAYATVEFAKRAIDEGADYISLLTPFYFKAQMTDTAMLKYYTYAADRLSVPVLIYCAPKFTGDLVISPSVVARLADHPNIAGMKDTSSEPIAHYAQAVQSKQFALMAGTINKYIDALDNGGVGGIISAANYLPIPCCEIQRLYETGHRERAVALAEDIRALTRLCSGKTGIAGTKACMTIMGLRGGYPRLPLLAVDNVEKERIKAELGRAGYLS